MFNRDMTIASFDEELWNAMQAEEKRQEAHIELIASENYASPAVLLTMVGGKIVWRDGF